MIDALIAGRLFQTAIARTAKNGSKFATAKLRTTMRDGASAIVNVISFSHSTVAALLALEDGDSIALSGELTVSTYTGADGTTRPSLDLVAHAVMTAYHVGRKRKAIKVDEPQQDGAFVDDELPEHL